MGERVHRVAEAQVMGRAAVLNLATWMVPAAIVQALTQDSSKLLEDFGGMALSSVWALALVLGAIGVWVARFVRDPLIATAFEVPGTLLLAVAIGAYAIAVLAEQGFVGAIFIVCLCGSSFTNLAGRARMLTDRSTRSRKATKESP